MPGQLMLMSRRRTLVGGDVAALGHGFNLGAILGKGIGLLNKLVNPVPQQPQLGTGFLTGGLTGGRLIGAASGAADAALINAIMLGAQAIWPAFNLAQATVLAGTPAASWIQKLMDFGYPADAAQSIARGAAGAVQGGRGGRRRRMNPLNVRALNRAGRRVGAFTKIARKYVSCRHGKAGLKKRRR